MMERLARLANRRARRDAGARIAGMFFLIAGALGAGVADRLDPYGADDPDTESVIADQRLEDAGYRETGVVVLVRGSRPASARVVGRRCAATRTWRSVTRGPVRRATAARPTWRPP